MATMKESRLALSSHAVRIMFASDLRNSTAVQMQPRNHEDTKKKEWPVFDLAERVERPGDAERARRGLGHFEQQPRVDPEDNRRRDRHDERNGQRWTGDGLRSHRLLLEIH